MADSPKIARGALVNTATAEVQEFHFNPKQINASIAPVYNRIPGLGSSSQRMHYGYTKNPTFNIDLFMDRQMLLERQGSGEISESDEFTADTLMEDLQKFLLSLVYPLGRQNDPIRRAPPRVLFLWPNIIEMPVRVTSEQFNYTKFKPTLGPWQYSVPIGLEGDLNGVRITSGVARTRGFMLAGYGG